MEATTRSDAGQRISDGMVHIYKEQMGRGPTKARTWLQDDLVVTVLGNSLTKAEEMLSRTGNTETVRNIRREFQSAVRDDMAKLIEEALQREVICVLSDHSPEPDYAVEVALLAPRPQAESQGSNGKPGALDEKQ